MPSTRLLLLPLLAALLLAGAPAQGRDTPLPAAAAKALARAQVPVEAVSVLLTEAGGHGAPLLSLHAEQPRNPASVMKLVTTLAGMEILGPNWSWNTPVYVDGTIRDGTLQGNLYLQGQGDPKLVVERLWLLLRRVQSLGIRHVTGDIVLDHHAFAVEPQDPGEFDGERLRPYNAGPDALLLNFKSVLMTFVPDATAQVARVHYEPPLEGVQLQATVPLAPGECGDYRSTLRAAVDDPARIAFAGRYPAGCGEKTWPMAYVDPARYNVRAIGGLWHEMGGTLGGQVREGRVPGQLKPMFEFPSLPLAEIVRTINKYSNNVMTQQLFLTLSQQQLGKGTLAGSRIIVQDWWRRHFGSVDEPTLSNGSGLSRSDRISARGLERLLQYAWSSPLMPELLSSLPITGQDGTLRRERWHAQGAAHLKTGSLRDVAAVAGIVHAKGGHRYVLVAIVNHPNAAATRPFMEALVEWAAQQTPHVRRRGQPQAGAE
jgi:D-alanyl-D-alanine carboxypeptidase/D-alanyl-D-alanine-endopeptidase (penicillin-binding protein 4)